MAKDIKMFKGSDEIIINENNLAHYEKLGYKPANTKTITKEKKSWQPITEKKVSLKQDLT
jgi:hypothetical protein